MSAFLGPIHYWLYNKIERQQQLVEELFSLGKEQGVDLEAECQALYGSFDKKPLEEMIDHYNIHGWLQERVSQVEYQYAYCISKLIKIHSDIYQTLIAIHKSNGAKLALMLKDENTNAIGIFKAVSDNLLDGMPCDHANRLLEQSEDELIWQRELCVHSSYWNEVGGDVKLYYELRDAWLTGLVGELGFSLERPDESTYCIKRLA
ncbi:MAG: hypothetical protein GX757_13850 [Clostridiales bacterium]|nr:hypothetical protein [Clostridiales bacterium]